MKLWLKYFLGILLGFALHAVLPPGSGAPESALPVWADFAVRISSYIVLPFVFFTLPVAVCERYDEERLWPSLGNTALAFAAGTLGAAALGLLAGLAFSPVRIPLRADIAAVTAPRFADFVASIFPYNPARIFADAQLSVVPPAFLAFVLGIAFSHDRVASRPAFALFDSLSHMTWQIGTFIAEILGALLIPAAALAAFRLRGIVATGFYARILTLIGAQTAIAALVIIPLVLWLANRRQNPFLTVYAFLGPALVAAIFADVRPAAFLLAKHGHESLGIPRKVDGLIIPLGLWAGRAGTALLSASAFVVILSSYAGPGLSGSNLLRILLVVPAAVFVAGSIQGPLNLAVLAATCAFFGRGFENGYLVMVPLAFPLAMAGNFLDALWIGAVSAMRAQAEART